MAQSRQVVRLSGLLYVNAAPRRCVHGAGVRCLKGDIYFKGAADTAMSLLEELLCVVTGDLPCFHLTERRYLLGTTFGGVRAALVECTT